MEIILVVFLLSAHCELTGALHRKHFLIDEAKSWSDAQKYCRRNYTDLSSLDSYFDLWKLQYAINVLNPASTSGQNNPYYDKHVWVGLNKTSTSTWQWSDGTKTYSSIYVDDKNNYFGPCALALENKLYENDCANQHAFFCYNWVPELILVQQNKSWEDAVQYCRTHHTDLASLPTYLHLIQVNQTTGISETSSVWTGLRFLAGSWFWLSREHLNDMDQLPACPDNYLYCGSRNWKTHSWENRDCMEKLNFLCY